MQIVVDAIIYKYRAHSGIARLYSEILPRMCDIDDSLQIALLVTGLHRQTLPMHPQIHRYSLFPVDKLLRPARLWWPILPQTRELAQLSWAGNSNGKIWHSTYYTMLERWQGPRVVTVADMIHERFAHLFRGRMNDQFRAQKRKCILAADAIVCISEATRSDLLDSYGIRADKTRVIQLAYSPVFGLMGDLDAALKPQTDKPFLLYVGDRIHYKNFAGFLRSYSTWHGLNEVDIVAVGTRWSKEEERYLGKLGVHDRVHLLSGIDDQHLCALYNQAAAFVYPSLYEGFGIPLLEAMACGCPIIASRIPSTIEVARECPIYFEPTDDESLHVAFNAALTEGRNSDRARLGLEQVKRYSWDKTARQMLEVYHALFNLD